MSLTANLNRPEIAILLCTHNGEAFLKEQLDSYARQTWDNWFLIASDDDSKDQTRDILTHYQQQWVLGKLEIVTGPNRGFAENFMTVTRHAYGRAGYYAWSDQDDIWHSDKLERALQWLQSVPPDVPALYCGRTQLVNSGNQDLGISPLFSRKPSFTNALMQSIGGGNTMVFNQAACRVLIETSLDTAMVSHDWWAYIIITGCGGQVYYDPVPSLRYRQHHNNLFGANNSWSARFMRVLQLFKGHLKRSNSLHIQALKKHQDKLTRENLETLELFANARQRLLPMRLLQLKRSGVHRQSLLDNLGLILAAIFRKI